MFGKTFSRALALATVVTMLMTSVAVADTLTVDGDTATAGVGNSDFELCDGASGSVTVGIELKYNGNRHFNPGTVSVTASGGPSFITAASGSLTIPANWGNGAGNVNTVSTSLSLAVASNWKAASVTEPAPWKVNYSLTQSGTAYTVDADNNVQITEKTTGCSGGGNSAPDLTSPGNQTVAEGSTLSFTLSATDADAGDTLTYSMSGHRNVAAPGDDNMSLNSSTGAFSWTPGDNYATYTVTFSVSDGTASDSETVTIDSTNVAPTTGAHATPFAVALTATGATATAKFNYSDVGWYDTHTGSFFTWTVNGTATNSTADLSVTGDTGTPKVEAGTAASERTFTPGCYTISVTGTARDDDGGQSAARTLATSYVLDVPTYEFLAPIKNDARNIAKYGNVIPVKVQVNSSCTLGSTLTNLTLHVTWARGVGADIEEGTATVGESASTADSGSQMRVADGFYIFNLATKNMTAGSDHTIRVRLGGNTSSDPILAAAVLLPKK